MRRIAICWRRCIGKSTVLCCGLCKSRVGDQHLPSLGFQLRTSPFLHKTRKKLANDAEQERKLRRRSCVPRPVGRVNKGRWIGLQAVPRDLAQVSSTKEVGFLCVQAQKYLSPSFCLSYPQACLHIRLRALEWLSSSRRPPSALGCCSLAGGRGHRDAFALPVHDPAGRSFLRVESEAQGTQHSCSQGSPTQKLFTDKWEKTYKDQQIVCLKKAPPSPAR